MNHSETPSSEPSDSSSDLLVAAFESFATVVRGKLAMTSWVAERKYELDDPVRATKALLLSRNPYLDHDKLEAVLLLLSRWLEPKGIERDSSPADAIVNVLNDCESILPGGYALTFMVTLMRQHVSNVKDRGSADELYASLFTGLIADFEAFVVGVFQTLYKRDPKKLSAAEGSISWAHVLEANDLASLQDEFIETSITNIMHGSFDDWMSVFQKRHDVDVHEYTSAPQVAEMFSRRHILIHNGGRVSRLYMQRCPKVEVELGESLSVSREYFEAAGDRLIIIALALTGKLLAKIQELPQDKVERIVTDWVYKLLADRRYQAVWDYLSVAPTDRMASMSSRHICSVNRWLALKGLERFEECRPDVEAWNVDYLDDRFQLAKLALLGKTKEAADKSSQMLNNGKLTRNQWLTWPLLDEVRVQVGETIRWKYNAQNEIHPEIVSPPAIEDSPAS